MLSFFIVSPTDNKNAPRKENKHRAMEDIKESIAELKYFKENVFKPSRPKKWHQTMTRMCEAYLDFLVRKNSLKIDKAPIVIWTIQASVWRLAIWYWKLATGFLFEKYRHAYDGRFRFIQQLIYFSNTSFL